MRVHFIAIGGSAMHNLAIALHKKGFNVTGSDDVLFEPSASRLGKYGILPAQEGWDAEKITADLDAVILGMHARIDNPELLKAQELGIRIYSYPDYIYEQSKDKIRVVIGGSHGKTTITSMILHVLQQAGKKFDYLVGAQLEGFETMVGLTHDAPVMIIEGDEYLASPIDRRPKFHIYKADIGVISGIAWDHINVFPTFDNYINQFKIFAETIQPNGKLIYSETDEVLYKMVSKLNVDVEKLPYNLPEYTIDNGITSIIADGKTYELEVFGQHNLLNMQAARLVCEALDINSADFYQHITTFKGAARRLEVVGKNDNATIFKDFAHSPSKLTATIDAVKAQFPDRQLIACIELHTFSSLNKDFLNEYAGTMNKADKAIVFIDRKTFEQKKIEPYPAEAVKNAFANADLLFFNQPAELLKYLEGLNIANSNFLMMSSGNFGGINLVELKNNLL
ncbi:MULTISPECIES: Mur ligase family protein [unclassified Mucilaginibacter]|uniref:UDP-N-acetylmuramate--L-alanine ligase n=2 Tax=Pseudomonadati TaxID=3379134 RepID=UPI002AC8B18E|nr:MULTISPECIES: Mur ligase family protein [unclassified Mucilaginibacter]MEB0260192.1 Mur ligase family protein [Mucilaginibacter sp. 10I4]MEB0277397.1 Mur ligase family protein [Mucilaginibacter sp. 10B2]MEB0300121.1 Mur ligase family protein [Mucilaginibacter sp. 5C4]WPX25521.1 Mur ligase family protein [Mucilaginibacter sp. 5C4]